MVSVLSEFQPVTSASRAWSKTGIPAANAGPQLSDVASQSANAGSLLGTQGSAVGMPVVPSSSPRPYRVCSAGNPCTSLNPNDERKEYDVAPGRPRLVVMRMTPWPARAPNTD